MGSLEPFLAYKKSEYRYLVVWGYKVVYRVTKDKVIISRIFHTA
jgi:plasmid stabilization system protein ParE